MLPLHTVPAVFQAQLGSCLYLMTMGVNVSRGACEPLDPLFCKTPTHAFITFSMCHFLVTCRRFTDNVGRNLMLDSTTANAFSINHLLTSSVTEIFIFYVNQLCVCVCVCVCAQSCLTLCDPMDCSPPGSSVHGIFQAVILEWVTISFSRGSSQTSY